MGTRDNDAPTGCAKAPQCCLPRDGGLRYALQVLHGLSSMPFSFYVGLAGVLAFSLVEPLARELAFVPCIQRFTVFQKIQR